MNLEHEFTVPVPIDEAWKVLLDVERVAPCMPGATLLSVDGDAFTGTVKVKVGPIQVTYKGEAKFVTKDEATHSAVLEASGKEARGSGTAGATVTTRLSSEGAKTTVKVGTELNITGRPAQFGRGVMSEVAARLIDQFAGCLAEELSGNPSSTGNPGNTGSSVGSSTPAEPVQSSTSTPLPPSPGAMTEAAPAPAAPLAQEPAPPRRTPEAIDLLDVAGGSIAKRLAPVVAALFVVVLFWRRRRR